MDHSGGVEVLGNREVTSIEIVMVPLNAQIVAGLRGLIVVCIGRVFLGSYNRQNNLASDPDTLGTKMALVSPSEMLLRDFKGTDQCSAPDLCMQSRNYRRRTREDGGGYRLDIVGGGNNPLAQNPHASCTVPHSGRLVSTIDLSIWARLARPVVNGALLTLLIVLYTSALRWNGRTSSNRSRITRIYELAGTLALGTLSNLQLVSQIMFLFFPTLMATLLEPF